jgi:hypothetical protein
VANTIDTVLRDLAEQIGKTPTLTCTAAVQTSERQKKFAMKRTKVSHLYSDVSHLKTKLIDGADWLACYGFLPMVVEPDFKRHTPRIRLENPLNSYPELDIMGNCVSFAKVHQENAGVLAAKYPHLAAQILGSSDPRDQLRNAEQVLSLVRYVDADQMLMYIPERSNLSIAQTPNVLGVCPVVVAMRSRFDEQIRGQMDDVLWVQLAKARLALLNMEAVEKTVQGPLAIPKDIRKLSFGPDAVIQTDFPEKIRKIGMEFPPAALQQMETYQNDLMQGARYPGTRSGKAPGSIVTGQGVDALEGGFDSQVMTYQTLMGAALKKALGLCFKMDEIIWPNMKKELRVMVNGNLFEETYTPSKDIAGIHEVEVTYGFAAGMDPNRALVFLLQMMSAGLIDRDFVLSQLPFELDTLQTLQRVDIEKLEDALKQGIFSMLTSIGVMAQQGQDPTQILMAVSKIIDQREKGVPLHTAVIAALKPPAPQGSPQAQPGTEQPSGPGGGPPPPGGGGQPGDLQQALMGGNPLQPGVAPGQTAPGGKPDLMSMLAGLTSGGQPQMQANVQSKQPIGP